MKMMMWSGVRTLCGGDGGDGGGGGVLCDHN